MLRGDIAAMRSMTYLNTGWAGPSPARVLRRVGEAVETESALGPAGPDGRDFTRRTTHEAIAAAARLIGAADHEVLLTHGTTEGVNIVLHGLTWEPGDELLTADLEHPALSVPARLLEERRGVVVKWAGFPAGATKERMLQAVDELLSKRTRVVALSHIQYSCGLRMPVREIAEAAHRVGALVLIDGAQTGGHVGLGVHELDVDGYAISGQKWLLGPNGSGALFIHDRLLEQLGSLFSATPGASEARALSAYGMTSQGVGVVAGFAEALAIANELGADAIEERTLELGMRLKTALADIPGVHLTGPTEHDVSCGLVSIAVHRWEPREFTEALWERSRIVARAVGYPAAVRFSTAHFNHEEDIDRAAEAVRALAKEASAP